MDDDTRPEPQYIVEIAEPYEPPPPGPLTAERAAPFIQKKIR